MDFTSKKISYKGRKKYNYPAEGGTVTTNNYYSGGGSGGGGVTMAQVNSAITSAITVEDASLKQWTTTNFADADHFHSSIEITDGLGIIQIQNLDNQDVITANADVIKLWTDEESYGLVMKADDEYDWQHYFMGNIKGDGNLELAQIKGSELISDSDVIAYGSSNVNVTDLTATITALQNRISALEQMLGVN